MGLRRISKHRTRRRLFLVTYDFIEKLLHEMASPVLSIVFSSQGWPSPELICAEAFRSRPVTGFVGRLFRRTWLNID
jgi:hypothetical protein